MIGWIHCSGSEAKRVVVRDIGPSLEGAGIYLPGAYTAIVAGKLGGIGLIEVYYVQ